MRLEKRKEKKTFIKANIRHSSERKSSYEARQGWIIFQIIKAYMALLTWEARGRLILGLSEILSNPVLGKLNERCTPCQLGMNIF